ncbi:pyridoxal-phosphate dependent enzyme [Thalassobaculum sp.]|uniref:pyridoxal-phosphate dependent enzyme n=1 Tax=Thalassobaculum sp. TaxID=2022740 RepID=UPI0032EB9521
MAYRLNQRLAGFRCLQCGTVHPVADHFAGCPVCLEAGSPSSVAAAYRGLPGILAAPGGRGCARYADWLAYRDWPSLGEGGTPLVEVPGLAEPPGAGRVLVKNEGQNPTGSHKDRMSMLAVARACEVGARAVVAASSGNAGHSVAAYAAAAGIDCVIVTMLGMSANWRRAVEMTGARLVATERPETRWTYVRDRIEGEGWFPVTNYLTPPVGSNCFGVDGFRTIAFELHEEIGAGSIGSVLVPTSRADLLWGIARGFRDLVEAGLARSAPKVHAVEPFPRISAVLDGADHRDSFPGSSALLSIGGDTVAYQALDALALCGGTAVAVAEADAVRDQKLLAGCGLYLELSSAAALTGLRRLRERGAVAPDETTVLIATSHGFKEEGVFDAGIPVVG